MFTRRLFSALTALVLIVTLCAAVLAPMVSAEAAVWPSSIRIEGNKYIAKGKTTKLTATVLPGGASQKVVWKSSNKKVATVSSSGVVKGIKPGKVKITASSKKHPQIKATFTIQVTKPVKSISLINPYDGPLDLYAGPDIVGLIVRTVPYDAAQAFRWESSNPRVARVNDQGIVTAVGVGTAKITVKAQDGTGKKKSIQLTVINSGGNPGTPTPDPATPTPEPTTPTPEPTTPTPEPTTPTPEPTTPTPEPATPTPEPTTPPPDPTNPPEPGTDGNHYALLIGNSTGYPDTVNQLKGPYYDVRAMKGMLQGLNQNWQVTMKENQTAQGMKSAIASAFSGATANDVCLFYYSGHGCTDDTSALVGVDYSPLSGQQLAYALNNACPGKVIVILDSCGSGGMVYNKKTKTLVKAKASKSFTQDMISAFSYWNKIDRNEKLQTLTTGELLQDKFQVIAGCEYRKTSLELSYTGGYSFGLMTMGVIDSMGCRYTSGAYSGSTPADANSDRKITLGELYSKAKAYVDKLVRELQAQYPNEDIEQNIQKSGNDSFVLFSR